LGVGSAVGDNQAAFEKEYGQLDPSNQSAMTRLGEQIGMKMAFKCPDFFALLSDKVQNYDQGDNDKYSKNPQAQNFPRGHLESKVLKGSGSGVIISKEGIIATNAHVVREASNVEVIIRLNGIVKTYSASVLVKDESNDIALLKIYPADLQGIPDVPFSISRRVDIGERVFTLGYPLSQIMGDNIKLTDGIISSNTGVKDDIKYYQISVPVQPGNSGGPLFDENGNLAGLTTAKLNESAVGANIENVNYAIKANYLLNVIDMFSDQFSFKFNSSLSDLELKDQVKVLKNYVCLIKIY
jgi:S1-C subfamily serine protease